MIKKVVKLSANWCFPCKVYGKTFEEVSNNDEFKDIIFEELDIDENEDFANKYYVRSVPTTLFMDEEDNVLTKLVGNITKNELEETLRSNLNG